MVNQTTGQDSHYFHTDAIGSTRMLTDESGATTDSYDYSAYGRLIDQQGDTVNRYLFTGEAYDGESDLYYLRARYMNPNLGRFVSRDTYDGTVNNPIAQNHYVYGNGNPGRFVDPSGFVSLIATINSIAIRGIVSKHLKTELRYGVIDTLASYLDQIKPDLGKKYIDETTVSIYTAFAFYLSVKKGKKKKIKEANYVPVINYGFTKLKYHRRHISDAIGGVGSNMTATPNVLRYNPKMKSNKKAKSDFLDHIKTQYPCNLNISVYYPQACDEYPFFVTKEGGWKPYKKGRVSIRPVPKSESTMQGSINNGFYSANGMNSSAKKGKYANIFLMNTTYPLTFWITWDLRKRLYP